MRGLRRVDKTEALQLMTKHGWLSRRPMVFREEVVRRSRLRQGALGWELLHDMGQPGRYLEQIVDESWTEHLRRFDRITAADVALRDRKLAFHVAEGPPLVTRYAVEPALRADTAD